MKKNKIMLTLVAISTLGFSFLANASDAGTGNGSVNVEKTKSYQEFINNQKVYDNSSFDNSVFVNHQSNR
jgi:hypothetical protein